MTTVVMKGRPRNMISRAVALVGRLREELPLGRRGERAAEKYLKRNGYRIVARNFRAAGAEIDLVAMDGETLGCVEVKTRRSRDAGAPGRRRRGWMSASRCGCGGRQRCFRCDIGSGRRICASISWRWTRRGSGWGLNF